MLEFVIIFATQVSIAAFYDLVLETFQAYSYFHIHFFPYEPKNSLKPTDATLATNKISSSKKV